MTVFLKATRVAAFLWRRCGRQPQRICGGPRSRIDAQCTTCVVTACVPHTRSTTAGLSSGAVLILTHGRPDKLFPAATAGLRGGDGTPRHAPFCASLPGATAGLRSGHRLITIALRAACALPGRESGRTRRRRGGLDPNAVRLSRV
jgi:hypothetical protein